MEWEVEKITFRLRDIVTAFNLVKDELPDDWHYEDVLDYMRNNPDETVSFINCEVK
jgi:predicted protein tyrosine phosphatase